MAKLTLSEVREIRRLRREENLTYREIANRIEKVTFQTVARIIKRELWRDR